jgi:hypothetical protein
VRSHRNPNGADWPHSVLNRRKQRQGKNIRSLLHLFPPAKNSSVFFIMASDTASDTTQRNGPWRLRFSLKWLFVVVAILCVCLGYYAARDRRAREMVALNHAILERMERNVATAPNDASFVMPESIRQSTARFLSRSRRDRDSQRRQIASFFGGGNLYGTSSFDVPLNVEKALATDSAAKVSSRVISHYESGLARIGLQRTITGGGEASRAVWQIPDHGISVIIDVNVDARSKQANVRTLFIHNEKLSIW